MAVEKIDTAQAPKAIGPYSQGVRAGDYVFYSGQIPLVPETGEMAGDDIVTQTERVMTNMGAALSAAGLDFGQVVKTTIYLTDLNDFATVNEIYGAHFGATPPARATIQVAALPKGAKVEIEWIAYCGGK